MKNLVENSKSIIKNAINNYPNIALSCSFGKDSMVVLDLAIDIKPDIQVFFIETRYKPKETLALKEIVTNEWNLNINTYSYDGKIDDSLYIINPDECCRLLKVEPTKRAIKELNLDAWITGLRKDEGYTRKEFEVIQKHKCGLVKINPILNWSEIDVWKYTAFNNLPINILYYYGYRSLGCLKCSKPYTKTERGGRWLNTIKQGGECGIHTKLLKEYKT